MAINRYFSRVIYSYDMTSFFLILCGHEKTNYNNKNPKILKGYVVKLKLYGKKYRIEENKRKTFRKRKKSGKVGKRKSSGKWGLK